MKIKKEVIPFGVYISILIFCISAPILLIWNIVIPAYSHDFPHFYHRGIECKENLFFFWAGLFVILEIFIPVIFVFFRNYRFKREPFWKKVWKKISEELKSLVNFKDEPFMIPILVCLLAFFGGIISIFIQGRTNAFSILSMAIGFIGLLVSLSLDGWWQKKRN